MAIIVEEEKIRGSPARAILWIAVLLILGITAYYLFLAEPEAADVLAPSGLDLLRPLGEAQINPEDVINDPTFQSLKQYVAKPEPGNAGRLNPFIPP